MNITTKTLKGFTLIELLAILVLLGILFFIAVPIINNIVKEAKSKVCDLDAKAMEKAAGNYISHDMITIKNGETKVITLKQLQTSGYISPMFSPYAKKTACTGYVVVTNEGKTGTDYYTFKSELKCGNTCVTANYDSTNDSSNGNTTGNDQTGPSDSDDLKDDMIIKNGDWYYEGLNPNNWVLFGRSDENDNKSAIMWRIVKIDDTGIKMVYEGNRNGGAQPLEDGRALIGGTTGVSWNSSGSNKWNEPTSLISKLDDWFSKVSIINREQYVSKAKWKVGGVPYNAPTLLQTFVNLQGIDSTNLGGNFSGLTNYTSEVGTINTVDFIYTSDNKACTSSYLETGSNNECAYNTSTGETNNFLQKSKYLYWTLNARSDVNNMAWNITNSGLVGSTIVNLTASSVRPVLNLKLSTKFLTGVGTIEDPYRLEDYMVNIPDSPTGSPQEPPQITLIGDNPIYLHVGDTYYDPGVKVIDSADGDISNLVTVTSNVDTSKIGNYQVIYNAKDSDGNAAIPQTRKVIVIDKDEPIITLNGSNPLYVIVTNSYTDPGAKAIDPNYGDISSNIVVTGSVDTNTIGNYYIDYNVTNADGLSAPTVTRKVIVKASTPTITLNGSSLKLINIGTSYTEEGATASDSVFGDLTSSIIKTIEKYDTVNKAWISTTNIETDDFNTYRIKYSVTNDFGANAFVYRNISIVSVNGPEITYNPNGITSSSKKIESAINVKRTNYDIDNTSLKYFIYPPNTRLSYRTLEEFERYFKSTYKDGSTLKIDGGTGYYTFYAMAKDVYKDTTYKMSNTFRMDNSAPVIYLNSGLSRILLGRSYIDPGATAYDQYYDGNLTSKIKVENNVDTSKLGIYTIRYTVADSAGNSTSVTRRVEVYHSLPKISLFGGSTIKVRYGTAFVDPGYNATDEVDGDLTNAVTVSGNVNSNKEGNYTLTYKVKNSSGYEVTNTRNVEIYIPSPVINITGNKQVRVLIGNTYTDAGATAIDELDGNLTNKIITTSNVDTSKAGTYKVTYTVTNNLGKTTTNERTVVVYVPNPVIQINGDNPTFIYKNQTYIEAGATATDELDGDLTSNIVIDTTALKNTVAGTYKIKYSVKNSEGGVGTAERSVIVKKSLTEILLNGEDTVTLIKGSNYTDPGYTAKDEVDGDVTSKVVVSFVGLNLNKVGTYTIKYTYTNSGGDYYEVKRTVIVRNPKVEIAVNGDKNINLPIGSPYIDEGAIATDELLGDISSKIVVTTNLNTNVLGNYTVTYKVNSSEVDAQAVRTINVVPMAGPSISYEPNGSSIYAKSYSTKITITKNRYDVDNNSFYYQWTTSTSKPLEESFVNKINNGDEISTPNLQSGKYYLWVIAKDVYGNTTELCSNGFNIDNTAPILSLNGSKVVEMPVDSTYKDLGVTVTENDSGLNASGVVITSNIVSGVIGKYTVTYNATDKAGNVATSITRTVSVIEASLKDAPGDNYVKKYDSTYFVGSNPNNWVLFGNAAESQYDYIPVYWRMIKADSSGIKIVYEGTMNDAKNNTNENGKIGLSLWDSVNNTWNRPADIKTMLNNFYNNLKDDNKTALVNPINWCVGRTPSPYEIDTFKNNECLTTSSDKTAIGMISGLDYLLTTTAACGGYNQQSCSTDNFLYKNYSYYTLSTDLESTQSAFIVNSNGGLTRTNTTDQNYIRPVINLKTDVLILSGTGTFDDPYKLNSRTPSIDTAAPTVTFNPATATTKLLQNSIEVVVTDNITGVDNTSLKYLWTTSSTQPTESLIINNFVNGDSIQIPNTDGKYYLWVVAKDRKGNKVITKGGQYTIDNNAPVITVLGSAEVRVAANTTYTDAGATAIDSLDGTITSKIVTTSTVTTAIPGVYTVTYRVTDTAGNSATATRKVTVYEVQPPTITFTPSAQSTYINYLNVKVDVSDNEAVDNSTLYYVWTTTATQPTESTIKTAFVNGATIPTPMGSTATYYLWVVAKDTNANKKIQGSGAIKIDNTKPVITLQGDTIVSMGIGGTYVDQGATASDDISGNLTSSILITTDINPAVSGVYTVRYNVTDAAGNTAVEVIRNVFVGIETVFTFDYTGSSQTFTAPFDGKYRLEVWGAGTNNGKGGYSVGIVNIFENDNLYVYVGGSSAASGYNGGATAAGSPAGGGATDIRINSGLWSDATGLNSRIIVAGGAGTHASSYSSGTGGGTAGGTGYSQTIPSSEGGGGTGGTQTSGGGGGKGYCSSGGSGAFGKGGIGGAGGQYCGSSIGGNGGGGWYGGGGGGSAYSYYSTRTPGAGGGGSGYVLTSTSTKPTGYIPGTKYYMTGASTVAGTSSMPNPAGGTMTGRSGNGYARITYLGN